MSEVADVSGGKEVKLLSHRRSGMRNEENEEERKKRAINLSGNTSAQQPLTSQVDCAKMGDDEDDDGGNDVGEQDKPPQFLDGGFGWMVLMACCIVAVRLSCIAVLASLLC